jgi:hypothetical protein
MAFSNSLNSIYICITSQYLISLCAKAQLFFSPWPTHFKGNSITFGLPVISVLLRNTGFQTIPEGLFL